MQLWTIHVCSSKVENVFMEYYEERLNSLALFHVHPNIPIDTEQIIEHSAIVPFLLHPPTHGCLLFYQTIHRSKMKCQCISMKCQCISFSMELAFFRFAGGSSSRHISPSISTASFSAILSISCSKIVFSLINDSFGLYLSLDQGSKSGLRTYGLVNITFSLSRCCFDKNLFFRAFLNSSYTVPTPLFFTLHLER